MKDVQRSQAYLRKRKMMMVLPLLVVPFLTMAFWALGGGDVVSNEKTQTQGLNLRLPTPKISYDFTDKLTVDSVIYHNQRATFSQHPNSTLTINFPAVFGIGKKDSAAIYYHGVPPVSGVTRDHIFGECNVRLVFDRDLVVVPNHDQVAEFLSSRQGRGLLLHRVRLHLGRH